MMIDETHDANLKCWVDTATGHANFPIQNLPLGIFSPSGEDPRGGVAIGDHILDLAALARSGLIDGLALQAAQAASGSALNPLLALGTAPRRALRASVSGLLSTPHHRAAVERLLHPAANCTMQLPATIGDYTDFYAGLNHATNVGTLFRPDAPLLPNYKYVPIGYHGRASTVVTSGTDVRRPHGQTKAPDAEQPSFGPVARLDYELELGVWLGAGNALGEAVPIAGAGDHIAGLTLLNDWSARDLQAWEYQPLGPFLSKSFLTTVSPWLVTVEALAPFRLPQPPRPTGDPRPLPYLWDDADQAHGAFAITIDVLIASQEMRRRGLPPQRLARVSATDLYWTIAQLVTHHSSNGCALRPGDLLGTGTISGMTRDSLGSLLELTRGGADPLSLPEGEQRSFLENGDELILSARCHSLGHISIGFGECRGIVVPAHRG